MNDIVNEAREELEGWKVDCWGLKEFYLTGTHREIVEGLLERIEELEQERDAALERVRVLESQVEASKGLYKHVKTEGLYYTITEATLETTGELVVVYRSISDGHDWVRPADEFFDGRFVRLEESKNV